MNESATVGDRVRINTAYYNRDRHLDGREGTVVSRVGNRYIVRLETGQTVETMAVSKVPVPRPGIRSATQGRLVQIDPSASNITTLDGRRVQAVQVAKQILGDVTVSEITELAAFLAPQTDDVAPATSSVGVIDTAAELERAKKIVDDGYDGSLQVWMDHSDDDDVVEVAGRYLKERAVTDLITFLQAALVVHKDLRSQATPF